MMEKSHEDDNRETESSRLQTEILLAEYGHAQDAAHHADVLIYEVAAIIWSGNTLLLGFILEARPEFGIQFVVAVLSILGILTSLFVTRTQSLSKIGQKIAFEICQEIEKNPAFTHKLDTKIDAVYPRGAARAWIRAITAAFIVVWLIVFAHAGYLTWILRCGKQ
jgi:hypothetical protein